MAIISTNHCSVTQFSQRFKTSCPVRHLDALLCIGRDAIQTASLRRQYVRCGSHKDGGQRKSGGSAQSFVRVYAEHETNGPPGAPWDVCTVSGFPCGCLNAIWGLPILAESIEFRRLLIKNNESQLHS